jgi:hypothetical protein
MRFFPDTPRIYVIGIFKPLPVFEKEMDYSLVVVTKPHYLYDPFIRILLVPGFDPFSFPVVSGISPTHEVVL